MECEAISVAGISKFLGSDRPLGERLSAQQPNNAKRRSNPDFLKRATLGNLWVRDDMIAAYPAVAQLGRWCAAYVATSVERAFGVMRGIDVANRNRMGLVMFKQQLISRYDRQRTSDLVRRALIEAIPPRFAPSSRVTPSDLPASLPEDPHSSSEDD